MYSASYGKKTNSMNSAEFIFFLFSAKFVNISAKFGFLNTQIRNELKNVIFIAFKGCKIFKYYINSMVISYSSCQKEKKKCIWDKYLIYAVLSRFQICHNIRVFFSPNLHSQSSELTKKIGFFSSLYSA